LEADPFPAAIITAIYSNFDGFTFGQIVGIIIIILLLILSGLMSASEVAYFSLTPQIIDKLRKKPGIIGLRILKLLVHPEKLLATILVANTFINIAIVILSTWISTSIFGTSLEGFIFQVVIVTFIILLFGEIMPKAYASQYNLQTARFMAVPISFLTALFYPVIYVLIRSSEALKKKMQYPSPVSINDLSHAIDLASNELHDDKKLLKGIINFVNIDVKEIMLPRMDVITVDMKSSFSKVIQLILDSGYSRLPVVSGSFDQVQGLLYVKDLLPHIHKSEFRWQSLIRPPYFIPETKKINDLLEEFQQKKIHLAVVIDEYGGASGIVTLEDILEEIVGDIDDEFDTDTNSGTVKLSENSYLFEGKTLLNDFYRTLKLPENTFDSVKGDSDTLAGLILEIKGSIPPKNEKIVIQNLEFMIKSADQRRIKQIMVTINNPISIETP
jgi:putative hemolysin